MPCYVLWFVALGSWKPIVIVVTSGRTCIICVEASSILLELTNDTPIPVAARPKAWVCDRSHAGILGSNAAGGMDVCLLSGRGLCDGLITYPE